MKKTNQKRLQRKNYKRAFHSMRKNFYTATAMFILLACMVLVSGWWKKSSEIISPLPSKIANIQVYARDVVREVEVPKDYRFTTEKQQIMAYIVEKFGDRADDAITMINSCENNGLQPRRVSKLNIQKSGRRSYDVGVMQINVEESDTAEIERLKDWKYNIDKGYEKYKAKNNTFYLWSCGHIAGDKTYKDNF